MFIGKFLGREARHKHDEVGNRLQYIEKHLEPPLISSNYEYAGAAVRPVLQGVRPAVRRAAEGLSFPCQIRIRRRVRRLQQVCGKCVKAAGYDGVR